MPKFPVVSGKAAIRTLQKHFGCWKEGQEGSHVKMRRMVGGRELNGTVPLHGELDMKTLLSLLHQLEIGKDEFVKALAKK